MLKFTSQKKRKNLYKISLLSKKHCSDFPFSQSQMDWQGQKVAEQWMQILLLVSAVIAFVTGYAIGSFQMMLLIYAGGVVLTALIIIPNWPWFNRHPLNWLDPSEADKHPKPQIVVNSGYKKKNSKQK